MEIIRDDLLTTCAAAVTSTTTVANMMADLHISSEDEEEEVVLTIRKRRKTTDMLRIRNFISDIVFQYQSKEFQSLFRMSKNTYEWLLAEIGTELTDLTTRTTSTGRPVIEAHKQLLSTLWLLATLDSFRSVAERFGMSERGLHKCFQRVIMVLKTQAPYICRWPDVVERDRTVKKFKEFCGIDGVVAVVDVTYVPIKAPFVSRECCVNQEGVYGMAVQGICDDNRKFVGVFTGYPSSVSHTSIFRKYIVYNKINRRSDRYFSPHQFMLGDKAFEMKPYCVPPYEEDTQLTNWQQEFNIQHARCRSIIEQAFALFFGRFRRFRFLDMTRTDWIPVTIIAGAVLHNICLMRGGDEMQDEFQAEGLQFVRQNPATNPNLRWRTLQKPEAAYKCEPEWRE